MPRARANPLEKVLYELFDHLNIIDGPFRHLALQLRQFVATVREHRQASAHNDLLPFASSSVVVRDVTLADGGLFPSGGFATQGEEYLRVAEYLIRRTAAWAVAQGWERFETFLKDITATFLLRHSTQADPAKYQKYVRRQRAKGQSAPATIAQWTLATAGGLIGFLRDHLHKPIPSPAVLGQITSRFRDRVTAFAAIEALQLGPSNCLSLLFSSCSCRNSRSPEIPSPPDFFFHLKNSPG